MKTMHTFLRLFLFLFIAFQATFAGNAVKAKASFNRTAVIENLINGVESDNMGLQVNSAQMLGSLEADEAVIPLLRLFNNSKHTGVKIAAALSLLQIKDARGIKAIKYAAIHSDNPILKKMCHRFYQCYINEKNCE